MNQPNVKNIKAWAIWLGLSVGGYVGVYDPPTRQSGCPIALFRTRIDARAHLAARDLRRGWPHAKVVRVIVSIQPQ